ncbi:multicopper oxidase family protein [Pontibacter litorisediminis]|uniref:multicopper oxidase family protein n=1 Tax=Pontibacter litorisediminis TaxID=1846260 RepID=UPI0023EB3EC0|nr:multicopper oxidase family protein [Pontibacter litorisediminis]
MITLHKDTEEGTGQSTITFELVAQKSIKTVAGQQAAVLTYNNRFPGPLLEVQEGQQVTVKYTNLLSEPSNLHLHGIFMSPEEDKPHQLVVPGESLNYTFEAHKGSAGMYWYHPHPHGSVTRQLFEGLYGPIIIRGAVDRLEPLASATEKVLVLHDIQLQNGEVAPHTGMDWGRGKEGELVLVNGERNPALEVPTGLLRLRLVNASTARYYHLSMPGKKLHVIGQDGSFLEKPVPMDTLLLTPGERADILIEATEAAELALLNLPYSRTPAGPSKDTPAHGAVLATFLVQGEPATVALPEQLNEVPAPDLTRAAAHKTLTFGAIMQPLQFTLDGKAFDHHRTDLTASAGTLEVWDIVNPMAMDHPFHLHTFPFQVISVNEEPSPYRAWKDVVNVPANSTVRIAVPFHQYTGRVMYHCHILEHEDYGMMGNLEVI